MLQGGQMTRITPSVWIYDKKIIRAFVATIIKILIVD